MLVNTQEIDLRYTAPALVAGSGPVTSPPLTAWRLFYAPAIFIGFCYYGAGHVLPAYIYFLLQ